MDSQHPSQQLVARYLSDTLAQFAERYRASLLRRESRDIDHPFGSYPGSTLSSWRGNMSKLSSLIDQLSELANAAPEERQPQLRRQVTSLYQEFTKQQGRYTKFLHLTKNYADKFLSDISEEVHQQSSFLDALEKRLAMARDLRNQAVNLRKSYQDGTLDRMKKVQSTVLSQPLLEDRKLFKEIDDILNEIQRCYIEMDNFWIDEVRRVSKALNRRRLDPEDIDRWRRFRESLEQSITEWETESPEGVSIAITLRTNPQSFTHGPSPIVSSLPRAFFAAKHALRSARRSASATREFVKPVHYSLMLKAESRLEENCRSCLEFIRECVRYGEKVAMICTSFTSYTSFWRTRASQDLGDQAASLRNDRTEVPVYTPILTGGMRMFNSIHEKAVLLLQKMVHKLDILLAYIPNCVAPMDSYLSFPISNIKRLHALSRIWLKIRDALEQELMVLPPVDVPSSTFLTVGSA